MSGDDRDDESLVSEDVEEVFNDFAGIDLEGSQVSGGGAFFGPVFDGNTGAGDEEDDQSTIQPFEVLRRFDSRSTCLVPLRKKANEPPQVCKCKATCGRHVQQRAKKPPASGWYRCVELGPDEPPERIFLEGFLTDTENKRGQEDDDAALAEFAQRRTPKAQDTNPLARLQTEKRGNRTPLTVTTGGEEGESPGGLSLEGQADELMRTKFVQFVAGLPKDEAELFQKGYGANDEFRKLVSIAEQKSRLDAYAQAKAEERKAEVSKAEKKKKAAAATSAAKAGRTKPKPSAGKQSAARKPSRSKASQIKKGRKERDVQSESSGDSDDESIPSLLPRGAESSDEEFGNDYYLLLDTGDAVWRPIGIYTSNTDAKHEGRKLKLRASKIRPYDTLQEAKVAYQAYEDLYKESRAKRKSARGKGSVWPPKNSSGESGSERSEPRSHRRRGKHRSSRRRRGRGSSESSARSSPGPVTPAMIEMGVVKSEDPEDARKRQTKMEDAGADPDRKTTGKAFGIETLSDATCILGLGPWDLAPNLRYEAIVSCVDILAFPSSSVLADNQAAIPEIREAVDAFTSLLGSQQPGGGRRLPRFRKPIALSRVKTADQLLSLWKNFTAGQKGLLDNIEGKLQTLYRFQGLTEADAKNRAVRCLVFRVMKDSLSYYGSLLLHLVSELYSAEHGENYEPVGKEIALRGEELQLLRDTCAGGITLVVDTYIYLRDGDAANWYSPKLAKMEMGELRSIAGSDGPGTGSRTVRVTRCSHCSGIHYQRGSSCKCPYLSMSPEQAEKQMGFDLEASGAQKAKKRTNRRPGGRDREEEAKGGEST